MKLEGPGTTVSKSAEALFTSLIDVRNFKKLMPDNTSEFELQRGNKFMFALKGMPRITLQLAEKYPHEKIIYKAADSKFAFTLTININEMAPEQSEMRFVFQGKFNTMMTMMIKNPISNFLMTLSKNTVKL